MNNYEIQRPDPNDPRYLETIGCSFSALSAWKEADRQTRMTGVKHREIDSETAQAITKEPNDYLW